MSQYRLIFTNIGLSKKQNAELNNDYIQITKFAVGSGNVVNLLPTMTGLIHEEYRADINNVDTKNGTTIFDLIVPSSVGGFYIKEVALFDVDGDCICIGTVPITYKVNQDEGASKTIHLKVSTTSTNTENIVFNTDDSLVYATVSYVNSKLEEKENVIQDGGLNIKKLDIDGATDIGANLVDTDLIVVDDGANGTNRKSTVSRIWTYISGKLTGAISGLLTTNLTASRALVSDANGKIAVSAVTSAELSVIDADTAPSTTTLTDAMGVVVSTPAMKQTLMSNFWTYISSKLTGAISGLLTTNLTASRALVSDANGKIAVSAVTSAEVGYLDGVTSNIQTQLGTKAPLSSPVFTGNPLSTTPPITDDSARIATTAYVRDMLLPGRVLGTIEFNGSTMVIAIKTGIVTGVTRSATGTYTVSITSTTIYTCAIAHSGGGQGYGVYIQSRTTTAIGLLAAYGGDNTTGVYNPGIINLTIFGV